MKKCRILRRVLALALSVLSLTGCVLIKKAPSAPERITLEQNEYRTGFYDGLYPQNLSFTDETYEIDRVVFRKVDSEKYDWVHAYIGFDGGETVYCLSSQWEDARAYYTNDENFTYYCQIYGAYPPVVEELPNVDSARFQALMDFGKNNCYDPFNAYKKVDKIVLNIPHEEVPPGLVFYKESNDGNFVSYRGYSFYDIDGKLYLLYYFYGEDAMHAVEVPEDLSEYFISLVHDCGITDNDNEADSDS